ncbi:hypothetical protein SAMN04487764_0162 [Gillisia sp. Hel1_33_143]|nr:hypothetical protein [Gillisia sp. Hel1_33_143]SDR67431.1 hypothetical protein SAMN04487764_0162 [Gillisia sp. Hel1_33_143]
MGVDLKINRDAGIISCMRIITRRGVVNLYIKVIDVNGGFKGF